MKLTKKIEYALMGLYFLAYVRPQTFVQVRTVAEEIGVPKRFLEQIFLALREHGILDSRRGSQGGYTLAVPATEVSLASLFRTLGEDTPPERPTLQGTGARRFVWNGQRSLWNGLERITLDTMFSDELRDYLRSGAGESVLYYI